MLDFFTKDKEQKSKQEVTVFKNPFDKSCIDEVTIRYRRRLFATTHTWWANVEFKNDLTSGKQETPECNSWEELQVHLKQIYDSLNTSL